MFLKMSSLSDAERNGFKNMFDIMSMKDILSLSDTVTNKLIAVGSTTEAVEAILSYTKDAEELLKRRKVHRDIIFKYLAKEGVVMPTDSDKNQLVKKTLQFWSTGKALDQQTPSVVTSLGLRPSASLSSPHGLVLVAVAGTIHRDTVCLGVYEQVFGPIRSPLEQNSWKIKFVNLKIRGPEVLGGAGELVSPSLTCSPTELQLLLLR
uniref:C3orf38 n=1 Tax=Esox lucius TaxID=8010 RepID=C1BY16_ESOLU|nr:C3orf38 [Esox lucius]